MGKKIGVLLENRFIDREILYYTERFAEEGFETVFLTRLWGMQELTFRGLELGQEITVNQSFEGMTDEALARYACIIVPAGYVADYLLYAEKPKEKSPAVCFLERVMAQKEILKGFICHALWIAGPLQTVFAGRRVTCHNNIISHVENAGMAYQNSDIYVDQDLITARTGGDYAKFAHTIIRQLKGENCNNV